MLAELFDIAEQNDIIIAEMSLAERQGMSVMDADGDCIIGIDSDSIDTIAEHNTVLAHEIGHCMTGSFYNRYSALDVRTKHEYRADKWAIHKLIPREDMQKAFMDGIVQVWELAEYFNVTEELIKKALWIYFDKAF